MQTGRSGGLLVFSSANRARTLSHGQVSWEAALHRSVWGQENVRLEAGTLGDGESRRLGQIGAMAISSLASRLQN